KGGLSLESDATYSSLIDANGKSEFKNNILHAHADIYKISSVNVAGASAAAVQAKAEANATLTLTNSADALLKDPFAINAPDLLPAAGSPALSGAAFSGDLANSFFSATAYKGAFGTTNWMAGWTN